MGEFRALRFVYGHGEDGFHRLQAAGQYPLDVAAAVAGGEGDAQQGAAGCVGGAAGFGNGEGDADIAVHQPQAVVVAGNEYRAAFEPALFQLQVAGLEPAGAAQGAADTRVQPFDAPGAFPECAQQLKVAVGGEHLAGPVVVGLARFAFAEVGLRGTYRLHHVQVVGVASRRRDGFAASVVTTFAAVGESGGVAVHHQAIQRRVVGVRQGEAGYIGVTLLEDLAHGAFLLFLLFLLILVGTKRAIDRFGELADAALGIEAVAHPQHGDGLVQRLAAFVVVAFGNRRAGHPL